MEDKQRRQSFLRSQSIREIGGSRSGGGSKNGEVKASSGVKEPSSYEIDEKYSEAVYEELHREQDATEAEEIRANLKNVIKRLKPDIDCQINAINELTGRYGLLACCPAHNLITRYQVSRSAAPFTYSHDGVRFFNGHWAKRWCRGLIMSVSVEARRVLGCISRKLPKPYP
ncbi:hypothetical protein ACLOJK_039820 [Asimina triloba]